MRRVWSWVAFGASLLVGCSSGGSADDSGAAPTPEPTEDGQPAFCDGLCAGMNRCGLEDTTCAMDCLARADLSGYRPSSLERIGACAKDADCKQLRLADPTADCFQQAHDDEPLRQTVIDYCEGASLSHFRCDTWLLVSECVTQVNLWQDAVLLRAQACLDNKCDKLFDCVKAQLEPMP